MAQLLADEDVDRHLVVALRELGHDVRTIQEEGLANQRTPDDAVLRHATQAGRAVLTHNRKDFVHLHGRGAGHCGILTVSRDPDAVAAAQRVDAEIASAEILNGQLIRVNRPPTSPNLREA